MPGDLMKDFGEDFGADFRAGLVELRWQFDSKCLGLFDDALTHCLAELAQPLGDGVLVEMRCRDGEGVDRRPALRVPRLIEGE